MRSHSDMLEMAVIGARVKDCLERLRREPCELVRSIIRKGVHQLRRDRLNVSDRGR